MQLFLLLLLFQPFLLRTLRLFFGQIKMCKKNYLNLIFCNLHTPLLLTTSPISATERTKKGKFWSMFNTSLLFGQQKNSFCSPRGRHVWQEGIQIQSYNMCDPTSHVWCIICMTPGKKRENTNCYKLVLGTDAGHTNAHASLTDDPE